MAWHGPPPKGKSGASTLTPQTQALLNDMMTKRGTSFRSASDIADSIQRGDSDWIGSLNTNTAAQRASTSKTKPLVKAPKVGRSTSLPALPGRFSGIKLQHEILRDTPSQREQFQSTGPGPDREAEKDKLSLVMQHGQKGVAELEARVAGLKAAAMKQPTQTQRFDVKEAKIDQIIDEIRERREFLESMRAAGKAEQYEVQVRAEIRVRLHELDSLGLAAAAPKPLAGTTRAGLLS